MGLIYKIFLLVMVFYLKFDGTKTLTWKMPGTPTTSAVFSLITLSLSSTLASIEKSGQYRQTTRRISPTRMTSSASIQVSSKILFSKKNQPDVSSTHSTTKATPIIDDLTQLTSINSKPNTNHTNQINATISENTKKSNSIFPADLNSWYKDPTADVFPMSSTPSISPSTYSKISDTTTLMTVQDETVFEDQLYSTQFMTPISCISSKCDTRQPPLEITSNTTTPSISRQQRKFTCDLHIPIQDCYEQENQTQTDTFVCLNTISSCHGNCAKILDSCSCDMHCEVYNVCCDDFKKVCPHVWKEAEQVLGSLLSIDIECVGATNRYLAIAGCSRNDSSEVDKNGCIKGDVQIITIGALYFKNKFCMRCNGFDEAESEKWNFFLRVAFERVVPAMFFNSLDSTNKKNILSKSTAEWEDSVRTSKTSRVCSKNMINECPPETSIRMKNECLSRKADVFVKTKRGTNLYKNKHCADCNVVSDYSCRGTKRGDYADSLRFRFSAIINVTLGERTDDFVLEANAPFQWKKAECSGRLADLNCKVTQCFSDIAPSNNTCGIQRTLNCVLLHFLFSPKSTVNSNCLANSTCIINVFEKLISKMLITGPGTRDDVKSISNYRLYDAINFRMRAHFSFTVFSGRFPFTLNNLYEAYRLVINNLLYEQGFQGEFTLCFGIFQDTTLCLDVECEYRTYTIHSPNSPHVKDEVKSFGCLKASSVSTVLASFFSSFLLSWIAIF